MGFLKKLILFVLLFVVLPSIASVALLKYTATPLVNGILAQRVKAPSYVEKVELNWSLTCLLLKKLKIENPKGFPKGDMLKLQKAKLDIEPQTYLVLKPYLRLTFGGFYLHFIRKSDNSTNWGVALGLPYEKGEVLPLEFKLKQTTGVIKVRTLKDIDYSLKGRFEGLGNNALFEIVGKADLSERNNPKAVADFVVNNWKLENNSYLNMIANLLANPQLRSVTLTKVEGRVAVDGPWVIFKDRNTKAYVINNRLFAEIYRGSKYNRLTKELDVKLALYIPNKVELEIYGNAEKPKVKFLNPAQLQKVMENNKGIKKLLEKPVKEIKKKLEETLKGLFH